jgi:hypothetical protein
MSDIPDPQEESPPEDLASEFQNLGENLKSIILGAWESEERQNLQKDIEDGLAGLGSSLKQTANEIQESDAGQRVKTEAEDLRDRVRSGEAETKIRSDLQSVLHKLNKELERVIPPIPQADESGEEEVEGE